ncbi:MAG: cold shock domain-containing protein [Ilumatobacteraceae bacterium]
MPSGRVTDFDEHVGLGHVTADSGSVHLFHCVEIADGTRTIDVGAEVEFDELVKFGRIEAANVRPQPRP